jgi:hypothetical protein
MKNNNTDLIKKNLTDSIAPLGVLVATNKSLIFPHIDLTRTFRVYDKHFSPEIQAWWEENERDNFYFDFEKKLNSLIFDSLQKLPLQDQINFYYQLKKYYGIQFFNIPIVVNRCPSVTTRWMQTRASDLLKILLDANVYNLLRQYNIIPQYSNLTLEELKVNLNVSWTSPEKFSTTIGTLFFIQSGYKHCQ